MTDIDNLKLKVDTTEIDIAIEKLEKLKKLQEETGCTAEDNAAVTE